MGHRTTKANHKVKVHKTASCRIDFLYYAFRNVLLVSIPLLIFSVFVFTIPHSSAEISSGTDNVQLVLSTSCTVNAVVASEHTVSLNGGQLDNNVGNTKLSAYCNDNNGYSIYAVGSSGDIDGNTDLVNTVNESYNIHTGVYNENNVSNPSSWAMKLTAGTGTGIDPVTGESVPTTPPTIINGYDSYSAIPNVYTKVAKRTSGTSMLTDSDASGSYLNTTYQIYANSYQPAGTYNGKVKYVIVHPNNNNDYLGFNEVFALSGKSPAMADGNKVYYAMQDMTTGICNQVGLYGEASQTQLVDIRDNNTYWVAKLEDGHCWMTQNLGFDIVADEQDLTKMKALTSEDTDLTDHSLAGAYADGYNYDTNTGIITWTPERGTTDFQNTTVTGWQDSNTEPYSANKRDDANTGHASLGNYYNWTIAIASNDSSSLTQDTISDIINNPKNSICPKGWRLPTISNQSSGDTGSTNEFARLYSLYGNFTVAPLYYIYSGFVWRSSLNSLGSRSMYTSSTLKSNTDMYVMELTNKTASIQNRDAGWSVRCVAR